MADDPRVAVEHPLVEHFETGAAVTVRELLHVTCSECGDVSDYADLGERHRLQRIAKAHADEVHDGLVDAVGWIR